MRRAYYTRIQPDLVSYPMLLELSLTYAMSAIPWRRLRSAKTPPKANICFRESCKNKVRGSFAAPNLKLARGPEQRGYQARKPLATKAGFAI